ncbi:MAG: DUF4190 domain-containing protein [Bifidobacteriaceae bacterium]|nr:DUF4190 domain-containing protein [Bifidobacteriaceae bacterium]
MQPQPEAYGTPVGYAPAAAALSPAAIPGQGADPPPASVGRQIAAAAIGIPVFVAAWYAAALLLTLILDSFDLFFVKVPLAGIPGWAAGGAVGRAAMGLRVRVHTTTRRPGARYLLRLALAALPAAVLALGPIYFLLDLDMVLILVAPIPLLVLVVAVITLAAGRPPKRSWYDKVSGTWVVDLRAPKRQARQAELDARRAQAIAAQMRLAGQYAGPYDPHGPAGIIMVPAEPRTNPLAIFSLVTGIIGGSVLSIIFGHIARSQIRRTGDNGAGMALAGLILGYIWLALSIAATIALIIFAAAIS